MKPWCVLSWILFIRSIKPSSTTAIEDGQQNAERTPLRFLTLLPFPAAPGALLSPSYSDGPSLLPAVRLAVEHVNDREGLLDGYELVAVADDSGCDVVPNAQLSFVKHVFGLGNASIRKETSYNDSASDSGGNIVGIIGPICSESALSVANLASRPQLAIVNVLQTSLETNRHLSFSILSPASDLVAALTAFTERAGWKRLAVLYDRNRLLYRELYQKFTTSVRMQVEVAVTGLSNMAGVPHTLSDIQTSGHRIIVLFLGAEYAAQVFCWSSKMGLTFPNYQWVVVAESSSEIVKNPLEKAEACEDGFIKSLRGSFLVNHQVKTSTDEYDVFYEQYSAELSRGSGALSPSVYGGLLYDSIWALALALNSSARVLEKRGLELAEYTYGMLEVSDIISHEMLKLEFNGVSGYIDFRVDGFSTRPIEIRQVISDEGREILLEQYAFDNLTMLSSGEIIDDSFPRSHHTFHPVVHIVFFVFIPLHLTVLVTVHIATLVFRNKSSVKASSTKMNQFNLAGNYLMLTTISLNNYIKAFNDDESHETISRLCQATWPWAHSIGSTLIVGSISLTTWRIYRIFIHYQNPGNFISDKMLSIFLCILVGIDLVIATTWTATDPIMVTVISERLTDDNGRIIIQESTMCASGSFKIWITIIVMYKITLMAALVTLLFLTRKIRNRNFNTQNLRILSYTLIFTIGIGFPLYLFLFFINAEDIADYIVLNIVIHSIVLQNIVLVHFPPLYPVLKEKLKRSNYRCNCYHFHP